MDNGLIKIIKNYHYKVGTPICLKYESCKGSHMNEVSRDVGVLRRVAATSIVNVDKTLLIIDSTFDNTSMAQ